MPNPRDTIECPVCRSRMGIRGHTGRAAITCRNGHRFLWHAPERPGPLLSRSRLLAVLILVLAVALLLAMRHPVSRLPFIRFG